MTDISAVKTPAEQALAEAFDLLSPHLPGALGPVRKQAMERFRASGLPHRRVEEWKYTDLRSLMREAFPLAAVNRQPVSGKTATDSLLAAVDHIRLVIVDGVYSPALSGVDSLPAGLEIISLADALAQNRADVIENLCASVPGNAVFDLNTAFMNDGVVIRVDDGVDVSVPVALEVRHTATTSQASFTRSLVSLGKGAKLTLVDTYEGPEGTPQQTNAALVFCIGDGAQLDRVSLQAHDLKSQHITTICATLGCEANLRSFALETGAALARNQLFVTCQGDNARVLLSGVTLLAGRRHADTTLVIDHAAPGGESRELFKAVIDGEARSVFQGKIVVRPGAQKTDGRMMSQSLLLSAAAEADAKPELEIFADDVQCAHGATCGALDEELLFYCKARGIPHAEAEAILLQAFVGEAFETVSHEQLRDQLSLLASAWLGRRT